MLFFKTQSIGKTGESAETRVLPTAFAFMLRNPSTKAFFMVNKIFASAPGGTNENVTTVTIEGGKNVRSNPHALDSSFKNTVIPPPKAWVRE